MKPVTAGDKMVCSECGVELEVKKSCGCGTCRIVCCGKPLEIIRKSEESCSCCCDS